MPKIILYIAVSLDGFIADKNDSVDWLDVYGDGDYGFAAFIKNIGSIIIGKRSYDIGVKQDWYKGDTYGNNPIVVVSETVPEEVSDQAEFYFVSNIKEAYEKAAELANGKDIYLFGGASLVQQFLNSSLLDEMYIHIAPILLGSGIRLFDNLRDQRILLERLDAQTYEHGLTTIHYKVLKDRGTEHEIH